MSNEEAIDEFINITGINRSVAQQYLTRNEFNIERAVNDYYNTENIIPGTKVKKPETNNPEPLSRNSGFGFRSFSDLRDGNKDHDTDEDDKDLNFFTGGQKSGLAVEDPNKSKNGRSLVEDLIEKAQKEAGEPDWRNNDTSSDEKTNKKQKSFKGTGYSLGSVENDVSSKTIEDSDEKNRFKRPEKVSRTITFWKEGFSVDDGELYKYDDPQNQEYLKQLNMGRAPLSLLNVQMFQDVDVNVVKKLDDSYHANQKTKPRVFGFQGSGHRLGSPVPGEPTTVEEALAKYESNSQPQSDVKPTTSNEKIKSEESIGDTSIQIRLATGERLVQRFNSSDRVEELYNFIALKTEGTRAWDLVTSFPPQPLTDKKSQTVAEAGLKNSVVIQKWI
jgi:UBX domain-containing protein 1